MGRGHRDVETDGRQRHGAPRSLPRLLFKPTHALIVILVLIIALCASLTMLIEQTMNYARQDSMATASLANSGQYGSASGSGNGFAKQGKGKSKSGAGESDAAQGSADDASAPQNAGTPGAQADSSLVDINTADAARLQTIKGVGPVMAQRIIDYRNSNGRFTSVDQLQQVSGIGSKTLEKMRGQVTVS